MTEQTISERLSVVAAAGLEAMPPELRAECQALADLDAASQGVRVHYDDERDVFELVWVGRRLGSVPGWSARGESAP